MDAMCTTNYGSIDFFRNTWYKSELEEMIEVFPNVFTYYLPKEDMIKALEKGMEEFIELSGIYPDTYNPKIEKYIKTIQELRSNNL